MNVNVVSVALFGESENNQTYLPAMIRAHHNLYRGWTFRIYHDRLLDSGTYAQELRALSERGLVELVLVDEFLRRERAFLWRLLPMWDDRVEHFLCRDTNTVSGYRERCAVEEWINSGLAFHAISDKRGSHDFQTLSGMIGFRSRQARALLGASSFDKLLSRWADSDWTGQKRKSNFTTNNQLFLLEQVWPLVQGSACEHRLSGSCVFAGTKMSLQEITLSNVAGVSESVKNESDALIPFIGSPDINLTRTIDFYRQYGDREIEEVISKCEHDVAASAPVKPAQPAATRRGTTGSVVTVPRGRSSHVSDTRLLVRMPTRSRPEQALHALTAYRSMAGIPIQIEVIVDEDDESMKSVDVLRKLAAQGCVVTVGSHKSKVEAVNGGRLTEWDVLLLASDDMVPIMDGYAARALEAMNLHFPRLDGAIYFDDGFQGKNCCTLPIMGRRLYDQFGHVYNPRYISLFCDQEQTELLTEMSRIVYVGERLIEHRHHVTGKSQKDALYNKNDAFWNVDKATYEARKYTRQPHAQLAFDTPPLWLTIGIATIKSRRDQLDKLLEHVYSQSTEHKLQVEVIVDDREQPPVGAKRQSILMQSKAHFIAFIDDDDWVADDYLDRVLGAIRSQPDADCVSLVGVITTNGRDPKRFYHSMEHSEWSGASDMFFRTPNHLNAIRRELALQVGFPPVKHGEDHSYSKAVFPKLKKEVSSGNDPLYFYQYVSRKY